MTCLYYRNNFRFSPSSTHTGTRNPTEPYIEGREWCVHEKSPKTEKYKMTLAPLECHDDPAQCPISKNER